MESKRKHTAIRYTLFCALILFADLLQNTAGLLPEIFGARCFLIIPALIILAISEEEITACLLGLFAGALWDMLSGVHMGFNCIFFAALCFIASALVNSLLRNTFITNMLVCGVSTVLYCVTYWLCFIVIKGVQGGELTILSFYLPSAVYTMAITPIVYFIYRPIIKKLKRD